MSLTRNVNIRYIVWKYCVFCCRVLVVLLVFLLVVVRCIAYRFSLFQGQRIEQKRRFICRSN